MIRTSGVSRTLIKLNEVLDAAARTYNMKYYEVLAKTRFFSVDAVRYVVIKLLFLHHFTEIILDNDMLFADILAFIDCCVTDSFIPEHNQCVRKTVLKETFAIVEF